MSVILFAFSLCASDNLLSNGDFELDNFRQELSFAWPSGSIAASHLQEDASWNRCLKLEIKKIESGAAHLLLGSADNAPGLPVKPNSTYRYSVELRGKLPEVSVFAAMWGNEEPVLNNARPGTAISSRPGDKWARLQGRFQTGADTQRAALVIKLWGEGKEPGGLNREAGQYLLIDNVSISEVRGLGKEQVTELPEAVLQRKVIQPSAQQHSGFRSYNSLGACKDDTRFSIEQEEDGFHLHIFCQQSTAVRANVKADGTGIWADDVVEIFFGPGPSQDRLLSQFVVAAGGGR
ncbi:MAG: hypothetical protein WCS95_08165, partial [Lentisphaeria bacterium]